MRAISIIGAVLDDDARARLLHAAPRDEWACAVAQAQAGGCAWRDWMGTFVLDHAASDDTVARRRAVALRLPAVVAARLPVKRPLRR